MAKSDSKTTDDIEQIETLASDLVRRLDLLMGGRAGNEISRPQYVLLSALQKQGPGAMGVLCHSLGSAQSTTSELVARMEKAGLVKKSRNLQDARVVWTEITDRGRSMMLQYRKRPRDAYQRLFADAGAEAPAEFLLSIEKLLAILDRASPAWQQTREAMRKKR